MQVLKLQDNTIPLLILCETVALVLEILNDCGNSRDSISGPIVLQGVLACLQIAHSGNDCRCAGAVPVLTVNGNIDDRQPES